MSKKKANLWLLVVAVIWGFSYIFVKMALNAGMHSGMLNAGRGTIYVLGCIIFFFP